jgi:hypothetical protein
LNWTAATPHPARINSKPEPAASVPDRRVSVALAAMVLAYTIVYASFAWIRYRYYIYADFDLAIFAQAVDGILHGRLYSSIRGMAGSATTRRWCCS